MHNSVAHPSSRCIHNFINSVTSCHLAFTCAYHHLGTSCLRRMMLRGIRLCYAMVYNINQSVHKWQLARGRSRISSSCIPECEHKTHATVGMLHNIFPLHTKTHRLSVSSIPLFILGRQAQGGWLLGANFNTAACDPTSFQFPLTRHADTYDTCWQIFG